MKESLPWYLSSVADFVIILKPYKDAPVHFLIKDPPSTAYDGNIVLSHRANGSTHTRSSQISRRVVRQIRLLRKSYNGASSRRSGLPSFRRTIWNVSSILSHSICKRAGGREIWLPLRRMHQVFNLDRRQRYQTPATTPFQPQTVPLLFKRRYLVSTILPLTSRLIGSYLSC